MKSEAFIGQLREAMTKLNLDEDVKEKHVNNFLMLFAGKTEEETDAIIEASGGFDGIINGINDLENKKHEYMLNDLEEEARQIKKISGEDIETDDFLSDTPPLETKEIQVAKSKRELQVSESEQSEASEDTLIRPTIRDTKKENNTDTDDKKPPIRMSRKAIKLAEKCAKLRRGMSDTAFIISVPFICIGIALIFALIVLLFPVLCILRLAVSILNIAVMILGAMLSGTGIVYGGIMFGSSPFAALYEIGLGITLGGFTLLLSVLLGNYIKRLSPFLNECTKNLYSSFIMCVKAFFTLRVREDKK